MNKRIYISADYAENDGDRKVVEELKKWGRDNKHSSDFVDMAEVVSGSVSKNNLDCRICDLKEEFNKQINKSSIVLLVVGDKTKARTAGSRCDMHMCTPYKQNTNGIQPCKRHSKPDSSDGSVNPINQYSYLRHEFEQAKEMGKQIVIVYNSSRRETSWLPSYMCGYEDKAVPFWTNDGYLSRSGNYKVIKRLLGYD